MSRDHDGTHEDTAQRSGYESWVVGSIETGHNTATVSAPGWGWEVRGSTADSAAQPPACGPRGAKGGLGGASRAPPAARDYGEVPQRAREAQRGVPGGRPPGT